MEPQTNAHLSPGDIWDLQLAAAVQKALLQCDIPTCQSGKIHVKNRMCNTVGGDFYHFKQLNNEQICFVVGDAMGHGTSAALIMSQILGVIQAEKASLSCPGIIVNKINHMLLKLGQAVDLPVTCSLFYGVVDLPSGILFYINAGHPFPIICNRTRCYTHQMGPTTKILGVDSEVQPESCHQFSKSDRLVLYTDGLEEAQNAEDDIFGRDRLTELISGCLNQTPHFLANTIFTQVDQYCNNQPHKDDQTIVIIDFDAVKHDNSKKN